MIAHGEELAALGMETVGLHPLPEELLVRQTMDHLPEATFFLAGARSRLA